METNWSYKLWFEIKIKTEIEKNTLSLSNYRFKYFGIKKLQNDVKSEKIEDLNSINLTNINSDDSINISYDKFKKMFSEFESSMDPSRNHRRFEIFFKLK